MTLSARPLIWTVDSLAEFLGAVTTGTDRGIVPIGRINNSMEHTAAGDLYVPHGLKQGDIQKVSEQAIARGAVAVMVEAGTPVTGDFPILRIPSMNTGMRRLARHARKRFKGKLVGVTGSVGKTTTKDMIALCLSYCGTTHHTTANLNAGRAHLAAVASLPKLADFSVLEIALRNRGAVRRKSAIARLHVAVITSIGLSHGAYHGADSADAILRGKTEIFSKLMQRGIAVIPSGDASYDRLVKRAQDSGRVQRIISCGKRETDDVRLLNHRLHPTWSEVSILTDGVQVDYRIAQPGAHFVLNSLLVAGVLRAVGADPAAMGGLADFVPTGRRVERFRGTLADGGVIELIDDAYNAAPDSVRALLGILALRDRVRRKVLILGDMLELGPDELRHHLELAPEIQAAGIDLLITIGPNATRIGQSLDGLETRSYPNAQAAARAVRSLLQDGDLVALKGSNGMKLVTITAELAGPIGQRRRQSHRWSIEMEPVRTP